jgi:competence protein CoiA
MQLYALDFRGEVINARRAERQKNYFCLECGGEVRIRRGSRRQSHFYHISSQTACRQNHKGADHLTIQSYLINQLPGESQMECPFPTICRIADVAWHSQNIVFEVQCSPITAEELTARNRDYQQAGWAVVWILHDKRYNQRRLTDAEMALRSLPHYFTNMNQWGKGEIYDQFDYCVNGIRAEKMSPLPIDFKQGLQKRPPEVKSFSFRFLEERSKNFSFYFSGDLMSIAVEDPSCSYLTEARILEKKLNTRSFLKKLRSIMLMIKKGIALPYRILFRLLLESACKS